MRKVLVLAILAWAGWVGTGQAQQAPALKKLEVNGASLIYQDQGQGPAVVFVHGSPGDHRTWEGERAGMD